MKRTIKLLLIILAVVVFLYILGSFFEYKYYRSISKCNVAPVQTYGVGFMDLGDRPQPECGKTFFDILLRTDIFFYSH